MQEKTMTHQLLLLRHAKSSWDDPSLSDHDRPLAKRGRRAAAAMRRFMKSENLSPDLVLVSTARRTRETLEALQPWRHPPRVEPVEALYEASAPGMLELLRKMKEEFRSILLIGHNPGLKDLAMLLLGSPATAAGGELAQRMAEAYPTGALAQFLVDGPWSRLGEGAGTLINFTIPRELKEAK